MFLKQFYLHMYDSVELSICIFLESILSYFIVSYLYLYTFIIHILNLIYDQWNARL